MIKQVEALTESAAVTLWLKKIHAAEKMYQSYYDCVAETRHAYKGQNENGDSTAAYHIFWSTVESQKPFLYFLQPKPCLERVHKSTGPVEKLACRILERALEWDLRQFDFDSVAKYVRNDYLISGCGLAWELYQPTFKTIDCAEETATVKTDETVVTRYIDPQNFVADCENVGIWENIGWMATKTFMKPVEAVAVFGDVAADLEKVSAETQDIAVYEIWDKGTKRVYWLSPEVPDRFLKVLDDPLRLTGFFPCPKPLFATLSNDSVIPVPDYMMIKELVRELNGITTRMRLTMQAVKVSGVYDNAFYQLGDIFEKDVTLVSLAEFDKLKSCGGIKGVIDFVPIEQYITALEQLAKRRADVQQQIFEITGVSDIMRGMSVNAKETATAVAQKTHFGTLRNQDRQNDMQRFLKDLYQIKAEIICAQFSKEKLLSFLTPAEQHDRAVAESAVALLRSEKMRGMVLGIETDSVFNHEQQTNDVLKTVETIGKMITEAMPIVSAQPLLLPLYRQMIETVVSVMPHARSFETVLEQVFGTVSADLAKQDVPASPPVMSGTPAVNSQALQLEQLKVRTQYEIDKEKNALKAKELDLKSRELDQKKVQLTQDLIAEQSKVQQVAGQVA